MPKQNENRWWIAIDLYCMHSFNSNCARRVHFKLVAPPPRESFIGLKKNSFEVSDKQWELFVRLLDKGDGYLGRYQLKINVFTYLS